MLPSGSCWMSWKAGMRCLRPAGSHIGDETLRAAITHVTLDLSGPYRKVYDTIPPTRPRS